MTRERRNNVTENNKLGLQEYDLVKTVGKGIGIVLRKQSLNDELVIYSISSAETTHPTDDDGMAKVRRYNADGTIKSTSETTGRRLKNRGIYKITGIKSYANPVLAMKDFINQNANIVFESVDEIEDTVDVEVAVETEEISPEMSAIFSQMLSILNSIDSKLNDLA